MRTLKWSDCSTIIKNNLSLEKERENERDWRLDLNKF